MTESLKFRNVGRRGPTKEANSWLVREGEFREVGYVWCMQVGERRERREGMVHLLYSSMNFEAVEWRSARVRGAIGARTGSTIWSRHEVDLDDSLYERLYVWLSMPILYIFSTLCCEKPGESC